MVLVVVVRADGVIHADGDGDRWHVVVWHARQDKTIRDVSSTDREKTRQSFVLPGMPYVCCHLLVVTQNIYRDYSCYRLSAIFKVKKSFHHYL